MLYIIAYIVLGLFTAYCIKGQYSYKNWNAPRLFVVFTWPVVYLILAIIFSLGYGKVTWKHKVVYKGSNRLY